MVSERGIIALLWIGLDGVLQSIGNLTGEERQLKKEGVFVRDESVSQKQNQLELIQKRRNELLESINKERAYVSMENAEIVTVQGTILRNSVVTDITVDSCPSGKKLSEMQELPFVVMSTDISAELLCEVTPDKQHVYFESSLPMNLYPDWEVLYALYPSIEKK